MGNVFDCLDMWYQELDFLVEAKNSEKCLDNFRKKSPHIADYVYAPKVYWNLSTSKLLTMEFMDGAHVNDVKTIQRLGIKPNEVATLVGSWTLIFLCSFYSLNFTTLENKMVKKLE